MNFEDLKWFSTCVAYGLTAAPALLAQSAVHAEIPNLSGFWELHFDSKNVPPADLTPTSIDRRQKRSVQK